MRTIAKRFVIQGLDLEKAQLDPNFFPGTISVKKKIDQNAYRAMTTETFNPLLARLLLFPSMFQG